MFYTEFDSLLPEEKRGVTFYPEKYAKQIDEVNTWVYDTVNNGSLPMPVPLTPPQSNPSPPIHLTPSPLFPHHSSPSPYLNNPLILTLRVYKCGFATTQKAYENNVFPLFQSLDRLEDMLAKSKGKYLLGDELTEADIRLYVTIVRFDPVYVQHFKCNLGTIRHKYLTPAFPASLGFLLSTSVFMDSIIVLLVSTAVRFLAFLTTCPSQYLLLLLFLL